MTVVRLNQSHREAFLRMLADYDANDPSPGKSYTPGGHNFVAYIQSLEDEENGIDLPENYVPCSHRWLLDDAGDICGIVRTRHNVDLPHLFDEVGHIGYDVPPAKRGNGYAILSLQAGLQSASEVGLAKVIVHCNDANPPSWRTIERCGGILERTFWSDYWNCNVRRYWIEL